MIDPIGHDGSLAGRLREEFDRSFATTAATREAGNVHLLAIRIGGDPYALPVSDIAGLHADRTVVPVPAALPEFQGVAGIRGEIVPVYSLAALMGYGRHAKKMRWLALCRSASVLGLAFDEFERHLNLSPDRIAAADASNGTAHVSALAHVDGTPRAIIDIPSILAAIAARCAAVTLSKEK